MKRTTSVKLITGFKEYSVDGLCHLGSDVAGNLLKLPIFGTLKPAPAVITTQVQSLLTATAMYGPGRAQAIDAAFNDLAATLSAVAVNAPQIEGVTNTDLAAIGIPLAKTPVKTTTAPDQVLNLVLDNAKEPGAIEGTCDPAGFNTRVYEGQWTLDPTATDGWSDIAIFPNSREISFTGLTRGKDVWARVRARNVIGAGPWSNPAVIMVT